MAAIDVRTGGSDASGRRPTPWAPVPPHHDLGRPLVLCAWDAPNMDACLHSVTGNTGSVSRPQFDVLGRWLSAVRPPGSGAGDHDVEGQLFTAIPTSRSAAMAPFISAVRLSGFGVFCRDRDEGDIDDAMISFVDQRLGERSVPGTLVVASSDQALGRRTVAPAAAAGWRVIIVGFGELCAWPEAAGFEFLDAEDITGLFEQPLDRFRLDRLPPGGVFAPPVRVLSPIRSDDDGIAAELLELIRREVDIGGGSVALAQLGARARADLRDFAERSARWSTFTDLVEQAVDGQSYAVHDRGTPGVRVVADRPDA